MWEIKKHPRFFPIFSRHSRWIGIVCSSIFVVRLIFSLSSASLTKHERKAKVFSFSHTRQHLEIWVCYTRISSHYSFGHRRNAALATRWMRVSHSICLTFSPTRERRGSAGISYLHTPCDHRSVREMLCAVRWQDSGVTDGFVLLISVI